MGKNFLAEYKLEREIIEFREVRDCTVRVIVAISLSLACITDSSLSTLVSNLDISESSLPQENKGTCGQIER